MKKFSKKFNVLVIAAVMFAAAIGLGVMTAEPVSAAAAAPTGLKYVAGYNSAIVSWNPVSGAQSYVLKWTNYKGNAITKKTTGTSFDCTGLTIRDSADNPKTYDIKVAAVVNGEEGTAATINVQPVRKMTITVKMKKTKTLGSGRNKVVLSKGRKVVTDSYKGGAYRFKKNGRWYTFSRITGKNASADYVKPGKKNHNGTSNYTDAEATNFINRYVKLNKISSGKKYLVWVSSYSQHVYVFKKVDGQWETFGRDWECSMGKASTPSPTGNNTLHKKIRFRHGINSWNCYASLNALHGVKGNWGKLLGKLASHGCIRNPKDQASWIYKNCSKGTKIIVY